jgi:methylmalonyl-CoA epimerase
MLPKNMENLLSSCTLDHVAVAVESIEKAKNFYQLLGVPFLQKDEYVEDQKVRVAFGQIDQVAKLELLESTDPEGPIAKHIQKRGAGLHHLCFLVKDIKAMQKTLEENHIVLLYKEPKIGAHQRLINFIHPKSSGGVLVEISQIVP